jgi:hypothetical protein
MALTDTRIRSLRAPAKAHKVSDSGGLYLHVTPQGSKLWRLAYRFDGKQKLLSFGSYPAISLQDARVKRDNAKRLLAAGTDPSHHARMEKIERQIAGSNSFDAVATEFLAKLEVVGKATATMKKKRWLLDFASSKFGARPVSGDYCFRDPRSASGSRGKGQLRNGPPTSFNRWPGIPVCHRDGPCRQ